MNNGSFDKKFASPAMREAQKIFKEMKDTKIVSDQEHQKRAFEANRERLKAERLARDTARDADKSKSDR